ncbi:MAG: isocitrate lyase/PEP mutase family protein [Alphaproteobacteria bacterium]|nr:isocitrate lyase/PEP mutase family protein [Alphaproteobacteria bacterium]
MTGETSPVGKLRALLREPGFLTMPCCYDALSARMIERASFRLSFMSGFAVSAARLGLPDTGLISYGEMLDQGRGICSAVSIPVIGDADTGYGNPLNVKRTVRGYAAAGFAGVMIEDQSWPKRCGHTHGKSVVSRDEALSRIRAAVDARDEGADIVLMARTDARGPHGLAEAIARARAFADMGADITFLEAPLSEDEMRAYCDAVPGAKMANMLEQGKTPVLPPARLEEIGYKIAAYPLTLMSAAMRAMQRTLAALSAGVPPDGLMDFAEIQDIVGFPAYDAEGCRYAGGEEPLPNSH